MASTAATDRPTSSSPSSKPSDNAASRRRRHPRTPPTPASAPGPARPRGITGRAALNPKVPAALIRDLATLRFVDAGESVILHGPVGVGKTMVAQALGHQACRRGHTVLFTKTSRLLADLAGGHADRTWQTRLRKWSRPAVLILDDFAMRDFTVSQADDLYELVTERATRSTVFTANRTATDWYSLFPNPVVAESILDRVVNTAHHVAMVGKSYRPNKRPGATRTTKP